MSTAFNDVALGWQGKTYTLKPTMEILNRIEQKVSLSSLAASFAVGAPKLSFVAVAVATMLQIAGADATDEQVYAELLHGDPATINNMAQAVILAAFPAVPNPGNVTRPKATKTAKARK